MNKYKGAKIWSSMYMRLLVRFLLLILAPMIVISGILFSSIQKNAEEQAQDAVNQIAGQVEANMRSQLAYVEEVRHKLSTENSLTTFLNAKYHESIDFQTYNTTVVSFLKGAMGLDYRNSLQVFMTNETIPEGYGIFYWYSRISSHPTILNFAASAQESAYFPISLFSGIEPSFETEPESLVYLSKIYTGNKLCAIIKMILPESALWGGQEDYSILAKDNSRILDFTSEQRAGEKHFPNEGSGEIGNISYTVIETEGLPLQVTLASDFPYSGHQANLLNILWIAALAIAMLTMAGTLFGFTRKVNRCLEQMNSALQADFSLRLPVQGQDEIAEISQNINLLLDRVKNLMEEAVERESISKQTQIYALQNQINPHFIYNTMELFSSRMELCGQYEQSEAMSDFARMLRYNINGSDRFALLSQEIDHTKSYLNIQRIRYPDIQCSIMVDKALYGCKVIRFLLQPFVENSIKHGLNPQNSKLKIHLSAVQTQEGELLFTVYDNGRGIDREELRQINQRLKNPGSTYAQEGKVGIDNINRRLRLFFGDRYSIEVYSVKSQWTMISFSIPLLEE